MLDTLPPGSYLAASHLPPQITPAMAGLRAASAAFTGRGPELGTLLEALAPRHDGVGSIEGGLSAGTAGASRKWIAGDRHLRHTAAMQTFPLRYPGNMLDPDALPRDSYTQVNNLLKLMELHLTDATIGLHLFAHRQLVPDLRASDEVAR